MKEALKQKVLRAIGTPDFIVREQPEICMIGFERISIENYQSILKYSVEEIELRLIRGKLKITGVQLMVKEIAERTICIEGVIKQICFSEEG